MNKKQLQVFVVGVTLVAFNVGATTVAHGESFTVTKVANSKSTDKAVTLSKTTDTTATISKAAAAKTDTGSTVETKGTTPNIRVLLGSRKSSTTVSSEVPFTIVNESGKKVGIVKANMPTILSIKGSTIYVNGEAIDKGVTIKPSKNTSPFMLQNKPYRGALKVSAAGSTGAMMLVNEVPLEDYLYGVVPQEVIPSWPAPALEAQAVAARTYALYTMETNKNKPYDVKPTTESQMYAGAGGEYASTTAAVNKTKGMVMLYNQKPINALFHSNGGGYTEDSVNVWGTVLPYLKGVKDYSKGSGSTDWTVTISKQKMEEYLSAAGKGVGTLKSIQLTPLGSPPMTTADRGVSGRIKQATFIGSAGKVTVNGDALRSMFGLKSTLFDFYVNANPNNSGAKSTSSAESKETAQGTTSASKVETYKPGKVYHTFTNKNDTIYIVGHGWGHGLGLSQWGAATMAKEAKSTDTNYYQTILKHYYSGISISKLY